METTQGEFGQLQNILGVGLNVDESRSASSYCQSQL